MNPIGSCRCGHLYAEHVQGAFDNYFCLHARAMTEIEFEMSASGGLNLVPGTRVEFCGWENCVATYVAEP